MLEIGAMFFIIGAVCAILGIMFSLIEGIEFLPIIWIGMFCLWLGICMIDFANYTENRSKKSDKIEKLIECQEIQEKYGITLTEEQMNVILEK